jgi:CHASE2 domain-containing sensor protein/signal transduction histidine kinase
MSKYRLFGEWLTLLVATLLLVVFANSRGWVERLDLNMLDLANSVQQQPADPDIAIVQIDDKSLTEIGNWPWDRTRHADLVRALDAIDPKVIAFDILFLETTDPQSDAELAEAIRQAGNVMLPHTFVARTDGEEGTLPAFPIPDLAEPASGMGHVSVFPDPDGVIRRFAPEYIDAALPFEHYSLAAARLAGEPRDELKSAGGALPIIRFNTAGSYTTTSASDVINGEVSAEFLKDKIVLIGATAQGLGDRYAVPTYAGRIMNGVEIQANVLDAVLGRKTITSLQTGLVIAIHIAAIVSLFFVYWLRPPAQALRYTIILIAALIIGAFACVILLRTYLPIAPALVAILIAYPLWGWRRLETVSRFLGGEVAALKQVGMVDDNAFAEKGEKAGERAAPLEMFDTAAGFDVVQKQVASLRGLSGEVRERLNFIQDVVDASPDPMMVFDGEGKLALFNATAQSTFLQGESDIELTLNEIVAQLGGEIDRANEEIQLPLDRTYLLASAPLDKALGSEIVAMRDITAIKLIEQQRRETLEFLSHDMRSPQVAIIGLAGTAGHSLEDGDRLDRIVEQARRTLKLADNFVQIARLENEGIRTEDTEMGALVHEAGDRAYALAKRKSITIKTRIPEDPVFCDVDASSFSRVIDNLLSNAVKYSPEKSAVQLELSEEGKSHMLLVVEDKGPGMPAERRDNPFARFGSHDTNAGPSAGLGLAYVKRSVDEHGGTIKLMAGAGKGTRFEIRLPVT